MQGIVRVCFVVVEFMYIVTPRRRRGRMGTVDTALDTLSGLWTACKRNRVDRWCAAQGKVRGVEFKLDLASTVLDASPHSEAF